MKVDNRIERQLYEDNKEDRKWMAGGMDYSRNSSGASSDILRNRTLLLHAFFAGDDNQWNIGVRG